MRGRPLPASTFTWWWTTRIGQGTAHGLSLMLSRCIYADLDGKERQRYAVLYPDKASTMTGFAQRFIEEGRQEGRLEGLQHGEVRVLTALLRLRFGELPTAAQRRIEQADAEPCCAGRNGY